MITSNTYFINNRESKQQIFETSLISLNLLSLVFEIQVEKAFPVETSRLRLPESKTWRNLTRFKTI